MRNIHTDNDSVFIDIWGTSLKFDHIQYALYQLNIMFEEQVIEDEYVINDYRETGDPFTVKYENGKYVHSICPYAWQCLDYVALVIENIGESVDKIFADYNIPLTPNWKEFGKNYLIEAKRLRKIFGDALGEATQAALNNQVAKYQKVYNEELSKDFGLSFGVISSSLTANLLYASQAASKEKKDRARAEKVADAAMKDSDAEITAQVYDAVYPIYIKSLEPAMKKLLSEYYAYIFTVCANELKTSVDEIFAIFDIKKSNAKLTRSKKNAKQNILVALQEHPDNGKIIGHAITYGVIDDELCEYGKKACTKFRLAVKQWAISSLKKIYDKDKMFSKPIVTDENRDIIQGLIYYYEYITENNIENSTWQEIVDEVYEDNTDAKQILFELVIQKKKNYFSSILENFKAEHTDISEIVEELVALADKYMARNIKTNAAIIFDLIIDLIPNEPLGYLGKAISIFNENILYDELFEPILKIGNNKTSACYTDISKRYVDYSLPDGLTFLAHACAGLRLDVVKILVSLGADVNIECKNVTALWHICFKQLPKNQINEGREIAKILLDNGAKIDIKNKSGVSLFNNKTDSEISKMIKAKYPMAQYGDAPWTDEDDEKKKQEDKIKAEITQKKKRRKWLLIGFLIGALEAFAAVTLFLEERMGEGIAFSIVTIVYFIIYIGLYRNRKK